MYERTAAIPSIDDRLGLSGQSMNFEVIVEVLC